MSHFKAESCVLLSGFGSLSPWSVVSIAMDLKWRLLCSRFALNAEETNVRAHGRTEASPRRGNEF